MISNHQENSVDLKKTEEHEVVISFGSNFDQKRQAPKQPPIEIPCNSA